MASRNFPKDFLLTFLPSTPFLRRQLLVGKGSFLKETSDNLLILERNLAGGNS